MKDSRMRDEDGYLTEHDPEPGDFNSRMRPPMNWEDLERPMIEERPVYGTCSKCHEHAEFFTDPYEQAKMSTCCWRPMLNLPEEP